MYVINSQGQQEPFSFKKIYISAQRVGASKPLARNIAKKIQQEAYPGITTKEIYQKIREALLKEEPVYGMRYSLKEAIRRLGPSGFPFEKYIGAIFRTLGFNVLLHQFVNGKCISNYEIDFLAKKEKQLIIGECKYHSLAGNRVDLKIALANYARFLDIKNGDFFKTDLMKKLKLRTMLITNTKFTSQVIQYAQCYKIDLIGWRYPELRGLEYLIESEKLYPITILPSINEHILTHLANYHLMLVKDIIGKECAKKLLKIGLKQEEIETLQKEANLLLSYTNNDKRFSL
ncbi:MAG: ATP cone domain-containing protein [Minisyncoccia bacterium]